MTTIKDNNEDRSLFGGQLELEYQQLANLAIQYDARGDRTQAARFFRLAGEQAAARYANEAAVEYLSLAIILTPDNLIGERFSLLLTRERVHALQGNQEARKQDLTSLEFLANVLRNDTHRADIAVRQAERNLEIGEYDTAISLSQAAVRLAQVAQSTQLEAAAYMTWGKALVRQGRHDWAQTQLSQALQLAQATTIRQLEADSIRAIGVLYLSQGDLTQARFCYLKAQAIYEEIDDCRGQSYTLNNLGHIAYDRGRFSEARDYWEQALMAYQAIGDRLGKAMVLSNLGAMHMDIGEYSQAKRHGEQALTISREVRSRMGESMALVNLALLDHYEGQSEQALGRGRKAMELGRHMDSRQVQGYAHISMAHALLDLDKPLEAQEAYWQSLAIWHELNQPNLVAEQRAGVARAKLALSQDAEAVAQVEEILTQLKQDGALEGAESPFRVYLTCYQVLHKVGDNRAEEILETAHTRLQERAQAIVDEPMRHSYLQNVVAHRQIINTYSQKSSSSDATPSSP
jgi:tetratricopeptide (TPR) repeat protein